MSPTSRARRLPLLIMLLGLAGHLLPGGALLAQESRRLKRIERPAAQAPLYQGPAIPLPTREQCEAAVRRIADDYGPGGLERHLADEFPYREELLDELEKVALYATRIELDVESIESVKLEPWRLAVAEPGGASEPPASDGGMEEGEGVTLFSDCIADVRTRLSFDDPDTGSRTVRDVGRAQWRLRFLTTTTTSTGE